jgi:PAS domain S-box-containing protein
MSETVNQRKFSISRQVSALHDRKVSTGPKDPEAMVENFRESDERYAKLFELVSDALFLIDKETGSILEVNAAAELMYGYSREELLTKRNVDLSAQPDETRRATREERATIPVRLHRKKDGTIFPVEITASHFTWRGRPVHMAAIRDITGRMKAQEALKESEEKFRLAFQTSPDAINLNRLSDGLFFDINEGFTRLTGYTREDTLGKTSTALNIWKDSGDRDRLVQALSEQGFVRNFEAEFRTKDGRIGTGLMSAHILCIGKEDYILSVTREITERKLMERRLHESEEKLRLFIEHAPASIAMLDRDMRYVFASRRWLTDFGLAEEDIIGRSHFEVFPEQREHWQAICRSCLYGATWRCDEDTLPRKHGGVEWIRWESRPWYEKDGAIGGIVIMSELITDRKLAEEQRVKLQEQLLQAQKMESVGRLAGGVAHDFNNMLGVIIGHVGLALEHTRPEDPTLHHLREIQKAAERSAELTRQLLAFARRQTVSPKILDLNDTVGGLLKMFRRLIGEDIELAWMPGHGLWNVRVDPSQIDQLLVNLTVNARDAIAGVGRISIVTANAGFNDLRDIDHPDFTPGEYVLMTVSDNGAGMSKEVLEHIFEPFFTTKEVGLGTGLGLATVYGIVRQNEGFIQVHSEPGCGSTFRIYLPRFTGEASDSLQQNLSTPIPGGTETVLVVEDDPSILRITKSILERLGYTPLTAERAEEALRLAREHPGDIHLLVTDVVMPEMNGRELARHLSALRPAMKCLYMSGYTTNVIAHHGVIDEGVSFIQKPFSVNQLAEKVREVLDP